MPDFLNPPNGLLKSRMVAGREGLVANPDYQPMPVRWYADVGAGGTWLGFSDTLTKPAGSKGKACRH